MENESTRLPRMMLGFVVRRCTVELGHPPNANEFAAWANGQGQPQGASRLFGRPIDEAEAALILKHQARLVAARSATPEEEYVAEEQSEPSATRATVIDLAAARARLEQKRNKRRQRG